jgi:hypothetical protein
MLKTHSCCWSGTLHSRNLAYNFPREQVVEWSLAQRKLCGGTQTAFSQEISAPRQLVGMPPLMNGTDCGDRTFLRSIVPFPFNASPFRVYYTGSRPAARVSADLVERKHSPDSDGVTAFMSQLEVSFPNFLLPTKPAQSAYKLPH